MATGTLALGRDWAPTPEFGPALQLNVPVRRALGALLLDLAALLGVAMLGVTLYAVATDTHPVVVRSGSMAPVLATGGLAVVRDVPASALHLDDVVTVKRPDGVTVTHRIVGLERQGPTAVLTLKGDANAEPDPVPVVVNHAGRLVWSVPYAGRVAAFFASARGGFLLGCFATAVVVTLRRR